MLEVLYLIFNEGYAASSGDDWVRPSLCEDALRLGRVLAQLAPSESEVHGLVALMELQASRLRARVVHPASRSCCSIKIADGGTTCLSVAALRRSNARKSSAAHSDLMLFKPLSLPATQARAHHKKLHGFVSSLSMMRLRSSRSPVVELNRAIAVGMAFGPQAGLEIADSLVGDPLLASYHLLPSVRGDLLFKLQRFHDARIEFERAAALTENIRERGLLLDRAAACTRTSSSS